MKNFRLSTKLLMGAVVASSLALSITACSDDDDDDEPAIPIVDPEEQTTIFITSDVTWAGDQIHYLDKRTVVTNGATLTIGAGAIIKGAAGSEADAKPLIIAKGAKIMARGTAAKPIIFTAEADNIQIGQITGTSLGALDRGLWAGLIILGDAPTSPKAGATDRVEGIPASVAEGIYGGSNPNDNSGVLEYVSIRHGGVELVPGGGNEINGLTLGGVGDGTTINHIEVVANLDDGIEWFGGSVNTANALVAYQGDDAFDIDQAYSGTITNIIYIAGKDGDHALEIDGPEGADNPNGKFTIKGGALRGERTSPKGEYVDFRSNAIGTVEDLYFFDFKPDADVELDADDDDKDQTVSMNYRDGDLVMRNCVFNTTVTLAEISADKANPTLTGFDFDTEFANDGNTIGTSATNFDKSQFVGWTWADANNLLNNF